MKKSFFECLVCGRMETAEGQLPRLEYLNEGTPDVNLGECMCCGAHASVIEYWREEEKT